jgi:heat shock protein HslJ
MRPPRPLTTIGVLVAGAAVALLLTACGDTTPGSGVDPATFDGDWQLTSATVDGAGLDLSAGDVTLTIDGEQWGGTAACNQYFATATLEGDQVTVGGVGSTEMACDEPRMALEAAYLTGLQRVTTVTTDSDTLTLSSGDGVVLEFGPVAPTPVADLVGTTWTLTTLLDGETASSTVGKPATLTLADDGTVTGSTGCRTFRGRWEQDSDTLTIGPLATPKIGCSPETQPQDTHVLAVLDGEVVVTLEGQSLTLERDGLALGYAAG